MTTTTKTDTNRLLSMKIKTRSVPELSHRQANLFWSKVDRRGPDECWNWLGLLTVGLKAGYGKFRIGQNSKAIDLRAHRVAFFLHNGHIPDGLLVLHKCDNRRCCNPAHLFLGTHDDNMRDASQKRRQAKGEKHGLAKLTEDQVRQIRRKHGSESMRSLARRFGVTMAAVWQIVHRNNWSHVS